MAAEDFYLFFSGTQARGGRISAKDDVKSGGQELPEGEVNQLDEFKDITERAGFKLNKWAWYGSVLGDLGVRNAFRKLTGAMGYVPGVSRLIIYGYSAGGKNALELCREFDKSNIGSDPPNIIVDLLVTVDAAAWDKSDTVDRQLGKCVKQNVNYFQEAGGMSGSHGAPNLRANDTQEVHNLLRDESHAEINDAVMPLAKRSIQKTINAASTEVALVGLWDTVIGDWRGLLEFTVNGDASWQETDPNRLKTDSKKHTGVWWEEGAEFRWSYKDDVKEYKRTFVARRPLEKMVKGKVLPEGRGFYEMTKRP